MASAIDTLDNGACCLKTCKNKTLKPSDNKVHVRAPYQQKQTELKCKDYDLLAIWDENAGAKFHMKCWKLIREEACRKSDDNKISEYEKLLVAEASMTVEFYNSYEILKREAKRVASMLKKCKHSIVFTGAGISTPTGADDYRGINGKWTNQTKSKGTQAKNMPKQSSVCLEEIRPTYTHEAIVKLIDIGLLKHVISQNTDGLHRLSGIPAEKISELHGNCFIEKCELCGKRCELHHGYRKGVTDQTVPAAECEMCKSNHRTGRRCREPACGGYMVSTTINFGDNLEESVLSGAVQEAEKATFVLVLGSSLMVSPANNIIQMAQEPLRLAICNRQVTPFDVKCFELDSSGINQLGSRIYGNCDDLMREVMKIVMEPEDLQNWEEGRTDRMKIYDTQRSHGNRGKNNTRNK